MVIIAVLYAVLVWLVFVQLKWLRWNWTSGTVTVLLGLVVCGTFVGFLNALAPVGRVVMLGKVVEVTPNVSGEIIEISVQPNQLVKAGTVLFRIDPAPYAAQVQTIEAQFKFSKLRLSQMSQLQSSGSGRTADVEQRQAEVDQLQGQLDGAKYNLDQTTIRAPNDGYISGLTLNKGDRATSSKSVMSFIVSDGIQLVGIFSQNGLQTVRPGAPVQFTLSQRPLRLYDSTIGDVMVIGVGEGQLTTSGTLSRITSLKMTDEYPALINIPKDIDPSALRLGISGTATVYAPNSKPFDIFGWLLLYVRALMLYL